MTDEQLTRAWTDDEIADLAWDSSVDVFVNQVVGSVMYMTNGRASPEQIVRVVRRIIMRVRRAYNRETQELAVRGGAGGLP